MINGCECEPYLTCDHRVMLEQTDKLISGIRMVMKATGALCAIIGVEDNKLDAVEHIRSMLPEESGISCEAVETKYPQGAEKMLITSLLGMEVPQAAYPRISVWQSTMSAPWPRWVIWYPRAGG